jgi:hypothetical protein
MALADLDRFLLMRETDLALHERLARPMDLEGFLALAADYGFNLDESMCSPLSSAKPRPKRPMPCNNGRLRSHGRFARSFMDKPGLGLAFLARELHHIGSFPVHFSRSSGHG